MASSSHGRRTRSKTSSMSSSININYPQQCFFRIILPHVLEQNKLKLPRKFVTRYGSQLSSTATLCLPNSAHVWRVSMEKIKEHADKAQEVWFRDGWSEFVDRHSIRKGFFLVFHYQGHSAFTVQIFDLTTCSVFYPHSPDNVVILDEVEDDDDDRKPTAREVTGANKRRRTHQNPTSFGDIERALERLKARGIETSVKLHSTIRKNKQRSRKWIKGIEEAILSNPKHPCFIVVVTPGHIRNKSRIMVPTSFGREHIGAKWRSVVLQLGKGKEDGLVGKKQWSVAVEGVKLGRKNDYLKLTEGWRQFMKDNLEEGGVCLFQLLSPNEPVMDVSVFPAQ